MSGKKVFTIYTPTNSIEADWLMDQGDYEGAIKELQKCLKNQTDPESRLFILKDLGYCYSRLNWLKEAVESFDQYLKGNPFDNDARFFRASAYASLKWTDEAIKELRIILALDPNDVLAQHDLALCYRDKGWMKESLNAMKKANDSARIYGYKDEQKIVASSLSQLEDETNKGDGRFIVGFLILIILLLKMKLKMKARYK
jgi:tetratricopeptide (TPR) repeat protein